MALWYHIVEMNCDSCSIPSLIYYCSLYRTMQPCALSHEGSEARVGRGWMMMWWGVVCVITWWMWKLLKQSGWCEVMRYVRDRQELVMCCILLWEKWNTHFFVYDVMRSDDDVMMLYPYVPRIVCKRMEQSLMNHSLGCGGGMSWVAKVGVDRGWRHMVE